MDKFRELIRGWFGKFLMVLFTVPFLFAGMFSYFAGRETAPLEVNGEKISQKELDDWINAQTDQYLQQVGGDQTLIDKNVITRQIYDAAIMRTLLLQQAQKLGFNLNDEQIGALVRQQAAFQENGQFSQQLFENYLRQSGMHVEQLLNDFRRQLVVSLMSSALTNTAVYGERQTQQILALLGQERTVHIAEVPLNQFAANFVATPAQVQSYYQSHQKDFIRPANVDVQYVILSKAPFVAQAQVSEAEINQQYQQFVVEKQKNATREISHILITADQRTPEQALKIAQDIEAKLKAGQAFNTLVQQYSEDPLSKAAQGKVEGYKTGVFGDSFDQAVAALRQGQISAPIKTQYGYHIIRLDHLDNQVPALAQVRDQMVQLAKQKKADSAFQDAVNHANDLAVQSDSLTAITEAYKAPVQTAKQVMKNTTIAVLAQQAVRQKLFSTEVAQGDRNTSTAIQLDNGDVLWLKVLDYRAEHPQSLAEATAQIQTLLKTQEQSKQAKAGVQNLLTALANKPANEALAGSHLSFQNLGTVSRFAANLPAPLMRAIFSVPTPKTGYWSTTTTTWNGHFYVIGVSAIAVNPQIQAMSAKDRLQALQSVDNRGQQELSDYLEYLKSTAKIKRAEKQ